VKEPESFNAKLHVAKHECVAFSLTLTLSMNLPECARLRAQQRSKQARLGDISARLRGMAVEFTALLS